MAAKGGVDKLIVWLPMHTNLGKNYGISTLRGCLPGFFFYSAVNKLITNKMQNIFSLTAQDSGLMKYSLDKLD